MNIAGILANLFTVQTLLAMLVGVLGGMIIGALPGLGSTMGIALLIPVTYTMEPAASIIMLTAVYTCATYGGSISAILLHTPGTVASAATAADGYAMTLKGQGLKAIGVSTISSGLGGFFSAIMLLFLAPPLAKASLAFSSAEIFFITIFGLTIIGSLSADAPAKGWASGVLGLCIAMIGYDVSYGVARYTYHITALESGIQTVPALIGLFSISQVMMQAETIKNKREHKDDGDEQVKKALAGMQGSFWPTRQEFFSMIPNIIRSGLIGLGVGILPGAGGDIGSWVSYNEAKRFSKDKESFGKGNYQGICASETANNAVTGGALIPLLTLGIPGSSASAVILGGLTIHGLIPGHALFTTQGDITYSIILGFGIANLLMVIVGVFAAKYVVKVTNVPNEVLAPIIVVLSVIGTYAINMSMIDVYVMAVLGFLGYFMRKFGIPTAPMVLGLILGSMAENSLNRSISLAKGVPVIQYFAGRPICIVFFILIIVSGFMPALMKQLEKKVVGKGREEANIGNASDD